MDERSARDIEIIIELFRKAELRDLLVRGPELSLHLSMDADSAEWGGASSVAPTAAIAQSPAAAPRRASVDGEGAEANSSASPGAVIDPAWIAVVAPNLGTFYRSPKPGSPAFVEVGQKIAAGTEVCLIEVMKLFTSVRCDVAGTVRHIAAEDAQLVEGGQPLIYIEAD
jgi:acetyl-CoA carboxylase biotin carboxyl carrier protein